MLSCVRLFGISWTVVHQAPLSMGFSRPEYWSGYPFPSPGGLPNPGNQLVSPVSTALTSRFFTTEPPGKPFAISNEGKEKGEKHCVPKFWLAY